MTEWVETFHVYPRSQTFEEYFQMTLSGGQGFRVLLHAPLCLRQIVAKRATENNIQIDVELPSGVSYTFAHAETTTEYILNTADGGTTWHPLAKGSFLLFSYNGSTIGLVEVALTLRPAPETVPWA